ncbi:arsenical pump family protein [Clostridia bacterium]|nr:arsenical pump family protein [Clostridia bacterium]
MILSSIIFVFAYVLIIADKMDRAVVALGGAALMIVAGVIRQENVFEYVDFGTLALLISMMVVVMVTKRCGIFQYLAVKAAKLAKGDPVRILIYLSIMVGVVSAFLDNVTTILLIIPLIFTICQELRVPPVPYIISAAFASNVGGTMTLVGDPPNIMIAGQTTLTFMDFIVFTLPVALPLLFITTYILAMVYKKKLVTTEERKAAVMAIDERALITDAGLLKKSMAVLGLMILGFVLHGVIGLESYVVAMCGAVALTLVSRADAEEILKEVEWKTILFFTGLFIMVGGLEAAGVLDMIAKSVVELTKGDMMLTAMAVLWVSAIASAFVDNIPFVATMIPLVHKMGIANGPNAVWIALSLGSCLGGNGTIIGASANVIASGMSERHGYKITFGMWFKAAFPLMILTIAVSTVYLLIRF